MMQMIEPWTGSWVVRQLGLAVIAEPAEAQEDLQRLTGLALRRNPKRPHLLVSTVLGKHVPTSPSVALGAGRLLGDRVAACLATDEPVDLVVGYAETATSLGHIVSDVLETSYLHSTRRQGGDAWTTFEEVHSHATAHRLVPRDPAMFRRHGPLVLVDDELSTGATAAETISVLHGLHRRDHYIVAALLDLRSDDDRASIAALAERMEVRIDVVALICGTALQVGVPSPRITQLVAQDPVVLPSDGQASQFVRLDARWPARIPEGARHGFKREHRQPFGVALDELGRSVAAVLTGRASIHVLGHEELMYLPLRLAERIEQLLGSAAVTFSSTTRSPVVVLDEPGYAVQHGLTFRAQDAPEDSAHRFAYNLAPGRYDAIVLVIDKRADTPELDGLLSLLAGLAPLVALVVVPETQASRP